MSAMAKSFRSFAFKPNGRTAISIAWNDLYIETVLACLSRYDVSVHALNIGRRGVRCIGRLLRPPPDLEEHCASRRRALELGSICASRMPNRILRILTGAAAARLGINLVDGLA
jgi:hypothetical protein